jgi:ERCC4-type nuclease
METQTKSPSRPPGRIKAPSECEPIIVIDSREQAPLTFSRFTTVAGTLQTGDYSILGLESMFAVERKSLPDLVACCCAGNREQFERELHRLRGFRFKRLLIVGGEQDILAERYRSNIRPQSVIATLGAFEVRYDLPVVFKPTPEAAAAQIERWAHWFSREILRAATNLTKATKELATG